MICKKKVIYLVLLLLLVLIFTGCQSTSTGKNEDKGIAYPERNIEFIVGWGAGGGTDLFARTIAKPLEKILGTNINVVNMPGASSAEAMSYIQEQPADGYTLFAVTSDIITNYALNRSPYGPEDIIPILRAHVDVGMLHVAKESQFKTWEDLVAYCKEHPNEISVGGVGAASFDEIVVNIIFNNAGVKINFVPFEEAGQMHASLLGGHIDVMYEEPGPAISLIENGDVRPLITTAEERLEKFPDVPSVTEFDYPVPPAIWRGVVVKKGTPPEIVETLEAAFKKAHESEEYKAYEKQRMLNLLPGYLGSKDFYEVMNRELEMYKKAISDLGFK